MEFGLPKAVLPSSARGCLCHPSCLLWFHGFWRTFEAAGCVPSVMSQPQKQDCHTLQRVDLARPFLVSPAIKIEIENSLEMALSKAKAVARGNPIFGGSAWPVWNSSARGCLCHPSCLLWFHVFWRTFEAAGCVPSVMSQPQKQDCHTLQRVDLARPFLVSPAIKIEIENSLEMALSKAKSGSAWQSHFWQCGTLRPARNTKLLHYASKSKLGFVQAASFNATGEDHFLESKKPMCLRPRK